MATSAGRRRTGDAHGGKGALLQPNRQDQLKARVTGATSRSRGQPCYSEGMIATAMGLPVNRQVIRRRYRPLLSESGSPRPLVHDLARSKAVCDQLQQPGAVRGQWRPAITPLAQRRAPSPRPRLQLEHRARIAHPEACRRRPARQTLAHHRHNHSLAQILRIRLSRPCQSRSRPAA